MSKNINMGFNLEKELKENFKNKVENDNKYTNVSKALNDLIKKYIENNEFNYHKKNSGYYAFAIEPEVKKNIKYIGENTKEFDNATQLIIKVIENYLKEM